VFRHRERMIKIIGVILAIMLLLSFTLPLLLAGR
jgi:hypothetical protein